MKFDPQVTCRVLIQGTGNMVAARPKQYEVQATVKLNGLTVIVKIGTDRENLEAQVRRRWVTNPHGDYMGQLVAILDTASLLVMQPQGDVLGWVLRVNAIEDELATFEALCEAVLATLRSELWNYGAYMEAQYALTDWENGFADRMANLTFEAEAGARPWA